MISGTSSGFLEFFPQMLNFLRGDDGLGANVVQIIHHINVIIC